MSTLRTILCSLAGAALTAGALAQAQFTEVKGVREFSGRMIVKPYSPTELQQRGLTASAARQRAFDAWLRIEKMVLRQEEEVGEAVIILPPGKSESQVSRELMASGLYEYVTPDWKVWPGRTPNDPLFSQQWQHVNMRSAAGWDIHTGIGVPVAVCDTGVQVAHPDFAGLTRPGYNAVDDRTQAQGGDITDVNGHGTHVAGCAAARGNNGVGVTGVTWNSPIIPVKVSNTPDGGAMLSDMMRGVRWGIDNGAKVANLSYHGLASPVFETTGAYVRSKGGLFVTIAGNFNDVWDGFDYPNVIVVAATDRFDRIASFSGTGRAVDVSAPGVDILATKNDSTYVAQSGTSMASPIVAGLAALVWSLAPTLTPLQVETLIYSTSDRVGAESTFGAGRVNVFRALQAANVSRTEQRVITASTAQVTLGTHSSGLLAALSAVDGSPYAINSAAIPRVGHAASVKASFTLPAALVNSFTVHGTARVSSSQNTTYSLFLTNPVTGRDELVASAPAGLFDTTLSFPVGSTSLSKYMTTAGVVHATLRAYAGDSRLSGAAAPFQMRADRLNIVADVRR